MTLFALSQALIVVAMVFDVMTFQFRERRHVVYSMVAAQVLIAAHFGLLDQWTAVLVITIAAIRKESRSNGFAALSVGYSLLLAWCVAGGFYQLAHHWLGRA